MYKLYGTFLTHLVENTLRESDRSLSAREISFKIHQLPTARDQSNLLIRVRRAIRDLEKQGLILKEKHRISNNLVCFKYKIHQHEQLH